MESNRLFHETIAQAAGNLYLQSLRFFHAKIADAIARRDTTDAEVWMEAHLAHLEHGAGNGRARARRHGEGS
jgi:DNA-binding FadR family transcriptional regulator